MKFFNFSSQQWEEPNSNLTFGIVGIYNNCIEYGYFVMSDDNIVVRLEDGCHQLAISYKQMQSKVFWDNSIGRYTLRPTNQKSGRVQKHQPYVGFGDRVYSASQYKAKYKDNQVVLKLLDYKAAKYLKYTFGIEFETSAGAVPQHELIPNGLIPLRDGSISGVEYATTVLRGNVGLNLLKQQTTLFKKWCTFNRDCALHIHFGAYPEDPNFLVRMNNLFVQLDINKYLPAYTFETYKYKSNGKNYNAKPRMFKTFEDMYRSLVGTNYYGSLYQAHPADIDHQHKWQVGTRYMAINFINAICYQDPKTIEFRFLRPSWRFDKIVGWIYIMNALMLYAESTLPLESSIPNILKAVYPEKLANLLISFLDTLKTVVEQQTKDDDFIGEAIHLDDHYLNQLDFEQKFMEYEED